MPLSKTFQDIIATGKAKLRDNVKLSLGTNDVWAWYSDGTDAVLEETGNQDALKVQAGNTIADELEQGGFDPITIGNLLNFDATEVIVDTHANRPAAGTADRIFVASDNGYIARDTGSAWEVMGASASALNSGGEDPLSVTNLDAGTLSDGDHLVNNSGSLAGEAPSSGGSQIGLSSASASSSSAVSFTSNIDSTYNRYKFVLDSVVPANDGVHLEAQYSTDGGSNWITGASAYQWAHAGTVQSFGGGSGDDQSSGDSAIQLTPLNQGSAAGEATNQTIYLHDPSNSSLFSTLSALGEFTEKSSVPGTYTVAGFEATAQSINAVRFLFSSGNVASGEFSLYGVSTP